MRLLFLGFGRIARRHLAAVRAQGGAFEPGVACADPARGRALVAEGAMAFAAPSYLEGIHDPSVGAVLIALPPDRHFALAKEALEAGKHVVLEKPATDTSAQFAELMALAQARGLRLYVTENHSFMPFHLKLRAMLREGAVGEIREVHVVRRGVNRASGTWRFDPGVTPGALHEGGVHWVRRMRELACPDPAREAQDGCRAVSSLRRDWTSPVELDSVSRFAFADGVQGIVTHSWIDAKSTPLGDFSRVTGSKGTLLFPGSNLFGMLKRGIVRPILPSLADRQGFAGLWRAIAADLAGDMPFPLPNAAILSDLQLVEECYRLQAAAHGQ